MIKKKTITKKSEPKPELKDLIEEQAKENRNYTALPDGAKKHVPSKDLKQKVKDRMNPERTFLVNFELRNGDHTQFFLNTAQDHFDYLGGQYIIDETLKYYNISASHYCLDYKQGFCLPLKRTWNTKAIQETIESSGLIQCGASTNPSSLDQFIKSKIAEGIMKAQEIDEFFKSIKFIVIVTCFASIISCLILVQQSGLLNNMSF